MPEGGVAPAFGILFRKKFGKTALLGRGMGEDESPLGKFSRNKSFEAKEPRSWASKVFAFHQTGERQTMHTSQPSDKMAATP